MSDRNNSPTPTALKGWTKAQLAKELGRSERTLDRWEELRTGPPRIHLGGMVFYPASCYEQWLDQKIQQAQVAA